MEDIHNKNPGSFAPHPYAIGGFFSMQQIIHLLWIREFYRADNEVESSLVRYAPYYAWGNVMIGIWMFFWVRRLPKRPLGNTPLILSKNADNLKGSMIPVCLNTAAQCYYVFALRTKNPNTYQSRLTNINAITFAGM